MTREGAILYRVVSEVTTELILEEGMSLVPW